MKLLSLLFCGSLAVPLLGHGDPDGIYADFSTSLGEFTASLNYTEAPQTVANFIGLAEGSRAWIDEASGAVKVRKPFYNGITFHRVIAGFMNQTGSPNGQGTDGPGYSFRDETGNGLLHNAPYKISMANSGPNTNGSQFFITVEPTPWLNGKHTVFGEVTTGQTVIDQINGVATGINDKPVTPVTINTVAIRRVGLAAAAFNIHAQGLPVCHGLAGNLAVQRNVATDWQMATPQPSGSIFKAYRSEDLNSWAFLKEIYRAPDDAGDSRVNLDNASLPRAFYHLPCVTYPGALGPSSLIGRTISAKLFSESQTISFVFNTTGQAGTGIYVTQSDVTNFNFTLAQAEPQPYTAIWKLNTDAFGGIRLRCALNSGTDVQIVGSHLLDTFGGYDIFGREIWNQLTTGTLTVSK